MTTVINPSTSPVAVFNKSGKAIVDMAINLGPSEPVVPIAHDAGHIVARVTATPIGFPEDGGVELPASADIGDVVEMLPVAQSYQPFKVWPPAGETIDGNANATVGTFLRVQKVDASDWRRG